MAESVEQAITKADEPASAGTENGDGENAAEPIVDVEIPAEAIKGYSDKLKKLVINALECDHI
jgi:hypothetical protein